jgi:1-acyl-sn-glycerol-3-phosphate acyltransferase
MRFLISIYIWTAGLLITITNFLVSGILSVILRPSPNRDKIIHAQCFWWADALVSINPFWKIDVRGLDNIDSHKAYVVVANHQSLADIIIIYKTHMYFKWIAKEELLKVPFLGELLKLNNHIMLSRGDFGSIKEMYRKAAETLKGGMSTVFFPEGTRSSTDEMGEFQNGAFKLAIKEHKGILPIHISGTRDAIPKGGFIFNAKVNGSLTILSPIDTSGMQIADYARLKDLVRSQLEKAALEI